MKNIFLLPTDKPSRIYLVKSNNRLGITSNNPEFTENFGSGTQNQHIYITSAEEIKVGDWYYLPRTNSVYKCIEDPTELNLEIRLGVAKIILTTDSSLIVDGIQPIDDEFLGWFVKNPSCEYVEVSEDYFKPSNMVYGHDTEPYKIIIPKEEPKLSNICIKCGVDLYTTEGKFTCQKHPNECKGIYLSKETLLTRAAEQKQIMSFDEYLERSKKLAKIVSKEPSKFWAESDERTRIREERKQHLIEIMKGDEELGLYDEPKQEYKYIGECNGNNGNGCFLDSCGHDCGCFTRVLKEEPKQDETEHLLSTQSNKERLLDDVKQERMYSEEDMKSFGDWCRNGLLNSEYGIEKIQEHLEQWKQLKNNKPPL